MLSPIPMCLSEYLYSMVLQSHRNVNSRSNAPVAVVWFPCGFCPFTWSRWPADGLSAPLTLANDRGLLENGAHRSPVSVSRRRH